MAEEDTKTPPAEAAAPAEQKADSNGKRGGKGARDETPIEELFDLSKPIPRVERPRKDEHDAKLKEIDERFEKLKQERQKVQEKIDGTMNSGKGSPIQKERDAFAQLRKQKGTLIDEKKAIRAQLEGLKAAGDKLAKDRKDTRSGVKFSTEKEIDAEIRRLEKLQETTSMSLSDEKKLIKEMDALKASKDKIKSLRSTETGMEDVKLKRKVINADLGAKDKEIDAVSKELDELSAKIKAMSDKETDKRGALDGLFKQRDQFKKEINTLFKEKDKVRDEFRDKNNAWFNAQRAIKAQKKIQYEEEKAIRDEERQAFLKKQKEEEAKKIPYEEEQALCDYLAGYLERTYLGGGEKKADEGQKEDVVSVKDDPFAGFKPVKKNEEEEYFGKGKGKKKRQRAKKQDDSKGPFTLNVDSFEQFGLLQLNPPTSLEMVENSVKELREKKEWYKQQPRGSVPTAKDIRKQNEKAAAKVRSGNASAPAASAPKGKFSLSNDEFAPLGKGASAAVGASSWGQKSALAPPAASDAAPTPAEAEAC